MHESGEPGVVDKHKYENEFVVRQREVWKAAKLYVALTSPDGKSDAEHLAAHKHAMQAVRATYGTENGIFGRNVGRRKILSDSDWDVVAGTPDDNPLRSALLSTLADTITHALLELTLGTAGHPLFTSSSPLL